MAETWQKKLDYPELVQKYCSPGTGLAQALSEPGQIQGGKFLLDRPEMVYSLLEYQATGHWNLGPDRVGSGSWEAGQCSGTQYTRNVPRQAGRWLDESSDC